MTTELETKTLELIDGLKSNELTKIYNMVLSALRESRRLESKRNKHNLYDGMIVEWSGHRGYHTGVIEKVNRVNAIVKESGCVSTRWNVPMTLLKPLP